MSAEVATTQPATKLHPFALALSARDLGAMRETITSDVVLNSPILSTPFEGREAVMELFEVIVDTLEDLHYTVALGEDNVRFMSFRARVGKVEMEGADILRLDDDGRIKEFTVFFRPLAGTATLAAALGKRLARKRSRLRSFVVAAASQPMVVMSRASDRVAPRLIE